MVCELVLDAEIFVKKLPIVQDSGKIVGASILVAIDSAPCIATKVSYAAREQQLQPLLHYPQATKQLFVGS